MRPLLRPIFAALALMATGRIAAGQTAPLPAPPDDRIVLGDLQALRFQPLGAENRLRLGYQKRLFRSDALTLKENYLFLGSAPVTTPASIKIGPSLEFQPLSLFNLRLGMDYIRYFGSFGALQSFNDPLHAKFTDSDMAAATAAGQNYGTSGMRFVVEPTVQGKFGPIAVRNRLALEYWSMGVRTGDTVFYEQSLDTLLSAKGFVLTDDLDFLYWADGAPWIAGIRYSLIQPLYSQRDFPTGEEARNANATQRWGLLGAYIFFDRGTSNFNKPMAVTWISWLTQHPWRTHSQTSNAIPMVVVGFSFESDLLLGGPSGR